jgi:hypothetical protein
MSAATRKGADRAEEREDRRREALERAHRFEVETRPRLIRERYRADLNHLTLARTI